MSIKIDKAICRGCKKCEAICPGNLICMDSGGKAKIRCPQDCWGCLSCVKECNYGAIRFFLGADIGGRGTTLYTESDDNTIQWIFEHPEKETRKIIINRKDSNAY
ncbi:MAG: 4Fe-4S dicluster domain-containing protein [Lachnospiraceae bacterium]